MTRKKMITLPFIYFGFLSFYLYLRNKKVDIAFLCSVIFSISGFFSILMYSFNLKSEEVSNYQIGFFPALSYIFLLTICLLPFINYSHLNIKSIKRIKNENALRIYAWVSFVWFLVTIAMSYKGFIGIFSGDIEAMRRALYRGEGDGGYVEALPSLIRYIYIATLMFFSCSWCFVFLAYYSLLIQRLPTKYFFIFLITSLSGPYLAMLGLDRSATAYWIIAVVAITFFFKPFMSNNQYKKVKISLSVIAPLLFLYLFIVTTARFGSGKDVSGSYNSLISYFGQSYINFCYFFDDFDSPYKSLNLLFPSISKYILGEDLIGAVKIQQYLTAKTGVSTGVFYTFIGHIVLTAGNIIAVLFCMVYSYISYHVVSVRRIKWSIINCFLYIFLSSIIFLGIFTYFYDLPKKTLSVFFTYLIIKHIFK